MSTSYLTIPQCCILQYLYNSTAAQHQMCNCRTKQGDLLVLRNTPRFLCHTLPSVTSHTPSRDVISLSMKQHYKKTNLVLLRLQFRNLVFHLVSLLLHGIKFVV